MANRITLLINNQEYDGWDAVSVTRSIDSISGKFNFSAVESTGFDNGLINKLSATLNDSCEVLINGERVISGYIDDKNISFDANNHTVSLSGRDKTCDLVDCACILNPDQLSNKTVAEIVSLIAAPYGIDVIDEIKSVMKVVRFKRNPGEKAFEAINRACSQRGVLPIVNSDGSLILRSLDNLEYAATSGLIEGVNIKAGRVRKSMRDRYSEYDVHGQAMSANIEQTSFRGKATDENITRHRPLVIVASGSVTETTVQRRAEWEAAIRVARSSTASITKVGWYRDDGILWSPGILVPVRSPTLGLDGDYLTKTVTMTYGSQGTICEFELTSPDAYNPKPVISKKSGDGSDDQEGRPNVDIFAPK